MFAMIILKYMFNISFMRIIKINYKSKDVFLSA